MADRRSKHSWMVATMPPCRASSIWPPTSDPAEELYDLRADPAQLRNLADDKTQAKPKAELRRLLDEWMRETGDPRATHDDPRATHDDDRWDRYPYYGRRGKTEPVKGE